MALTKEEIPAKIETLLGCPTRWLPSDRAVGDYDGRELTLEVFFVDALEEREFHRILWEHRKEFKEAVGGEITAIFHTKIETRRLFPNLFG